MGAGRALSRGLLRASGCKGCTDTDAPGCTTLSFLCEEETRFCVLVNLDLQNFQLLGFSDFLHLVDEAIGEFL